MPVQLTNPLATPAQLSQRFGASRMPTDLLDIVFVAVQCLTQAAGQLLDLPQSVTAHANVLLARYWLLTPPLAHEFADLSAAAIFLVAKMGPVPRSPRDLSNVYAYLTSPNSFLFRMGAPLLDDPATYYRTESEYASFQTRLLDLEAQILYSMSFDTQVALPHPLAITYLQALGFFGQPREKISQRAVAHLNSALLSPQLLYLTHQPNELASAALFLAAREVGAKMPPDPWWELFDVDREQLGFLVCAIHSLEGLVRQQRADYPALFEGMVTRRAIRAELAKKGQEMPPLSRESEDEESAIMRRMDEDVQ